MLGKLIKYEFRATYRFMLMIYSLLFISGVILALGVRFNDFVSQIEVSEAALTIGETIIGTLGVVFVSLFIIGTVFVLSVTTFYSIKRFHDNILGDGGYLMHTLPVKTYENVWSKCITSVLWTVISSAVVIVVYYILALISYSSETILITTEAFSSIDWSFLAELENVILIIEIILLSVLSLVNLYIHIYASMAIGYSFNSNRILASVLCYVGFNIIKSILSTTISVPFMFWDDTYLPAFLLGVRLVTELAFLVVCSLIANYYLKNKLNL